MWLNRMYIYARQHLPYLPTSSYLELPEHVHIPNAHMPIRSIYPPPGSAPAVRRIYIALETAVPSTDSTNAAFQGRLVLAQVLVEVIQRPRLRNMPPLPRSLQPRLQLVLRPRIRRIRRLHLRRHPALAVEIQAIDARSEILLDGDRRDRRRIMRAQIRFREPVFVHSRRLRTRGSRRCGGGRLGARCVRLCTHRLLRVAPLRG